MVQNELSRARNAYNLGAAFISKSGIPRDLKLATSYLDKEISIEQKLQQVMGTELENKPGIRFTYSELNYDILDLVIQQVMKQSSQQLVEEHILKPLGINNTHIWGSNDEHMAKLTMGYKVNFLNQESILILSGLLFEY